MRSLIVVSGALLPSAAVVCQPVDALQSWLESHALPVKSIAISDEDFSDLEPLAAAIGAARVVQLGEPSHGAGSSFAAKARLIKFLHERMGFDVLVWESGLYDVRLTQTGLRSAESATQAAQRGIFPVWSSSAEVAPLFEFARSTQTSIRPLEMAGFDMQFSGAKSLDRFAVDMQAFGVALRDVEMREQFAMLFENALAQYRILKDPAAQDASSAQALQVFLGNVDLLLEALQRGRKACEAVHGAREVSFTQRLIANFRAAGANMYDIRTADRLSGAAAQLPFKRAWNRRDAQSADNLRWLVDEYYAGRKIVVWAHNGHLMNAYYAADWSSLHARPQSGGMKPLGTYMREWLGDRVYSIGFTTYGGEDGWTTEGGAVTAVPAPAPAGLEARLHKLGQPYLFLDVRSLQDRPRHPLHRPIALHARGYMNDAVPDMTKVFDAIFYIDRMQPATRLTALAP